MPDNNTGVLKALFNVFRGEKRLPAEIFRRVALTILCSDLAENLVVIVSGAPFIDAAHKPVKWELGADGKENQITDPSKTGPSGEARCGHWVSQRVAWAPAFWPDNDISSALAMLSIQTVRAPISFPNRMAK